MKNFLKILVILMIVTLAVPHGPGKAESNFSLLPETTTHSLLLAHPVYPAPHALRVGVAMVDWGVVSIGVGPSLDTLDWKLMTLGDMTGSTWPSWDQYTSDDLSGPLTIAMHQINAQLTGFVLPGTGTPTGILTQRGDHVVSVTHFWPSSPPMIRFTESLYVNGNLIVTTTDPVTRHWTNYIQTRNNPVQGNRLTSAEPIGSMLDVRFLYGDPVSWCEGHSYRWGLSGGPLVEPDISIINTNIPPFDGSVLTSDGITFDRIGSFPFNYEIRDSHGTAVFPEPFFWDNTVAYGSNTITVYTDLAPMLKYNYPAGTLTADGTDISLLTYDPDLPGDLPCGGEDGWTNQPLDISTDPDTILGAFDAIVSLPDYSTTATNDIATRLSYHTESPDDQGTTVSGILTEIANDSNTLSDIAEGFVKIDKTEPNPGVRHNGKLDFADDSEDVLSGLSASRPSKIAFSAPGGLQPLPGDFTAFDSIPSLADGFYDVWVWATDKAGNEAIEMVLGSVYTGGEVVVSKDSTSGATLHDKDCPNGGSITYDSGCLGDCGVGIGVQVEEKSSLTYQLVLKNTDAFDSATGTFTDDFPEGSIVSITPSATSTPLGTGTISNINMNLGGSGSGHEGQYRVTGDYYLPAGEEMVIDIVCIAPKFDAVVLTNNNIQNQASITWTLGTGMGERTGSHVSNYAVHELTEIPGVETTFTKVGADALNTGLAGAQFALYRWDGAVPISPADASHMVDAYTDIQDGDWTRVKYDGEDAAMTDVFVSSSSPLGEVDFGKLPEGIYTLVEIKAPSGYELPMGQWLLTIDPTKNDTGDGNWKIEFEGKSHSMMPPAAIRETGGTEPTYKIINARPFSIGMSGLGGTRGLLLAGFVLMALAGNAYIAYSYKQRKQGK